MALTKVLARKWKFEIETTTPDTFVVIKGINTFTLPPPEAQEADASDFDNDGWDDSVVVGRNQTLTLEGLRIEDPANGNRDAGQERMEVLGRETGDLAEAKFRITTPGNDTITGKVSVSTAGGSGGGTRDLSSWSGAVKFKGKPTFS